MTELERAVLEVLACSDDALGWYQIERRLSNMALSERSNLLTVLAVLRDQGFIEEAAASTLPTIRHAITASGRAALAATATNLDG